jgi:hypothetical protein
MTTSAKKSAPRAASQDSRAFVVGAPIALVFGEGGTNSCVLFHVARCVVSKTTAKAVQVSATTQSGAPVTAWFPLAALKTREQSEYTRLASWFTCDDWQSRFFELCGQFERV